jgi:hypothetical protein
MLSYEDFYNYVWVNYVAETDVSYQYREKNQDFIRLLTFSAYNKYKTKNVHESVYGEMIKSFFNCLFLYSPDTSDNIEY